MNKIWSRLYDAAPLALGCSLLVAGCGGGHVGAAAGAARANVFITTTTTIPANGQCTHITATRLADFAVSEYKGALSGAVLQALVGDTRVSATAYAPPCAVEPPLAPWLSDAQIVTFNDGANTLTLTFHENVNVTVNPVFDNDPAPLAVRTLMRTGRNGEDAAGPNLSLDGWQVKQFPVPPATGAETVLFTTEGKGLPYSPRGMAHLPDGSFLFQLGDDVSPLYAFDATGNATGTIPVAGFSAGQLQWNGTDGLEAIDATHLVRTGYAYSPIGCDDNGANCTSAGLDVLTRQTGSDGSVSYVVTSQVRLPTLATENLAQEYPVGVTPVPGNRFAVTTLPGDGNSRLVILGSDGTLVAGPITIANDVEGLFDDGAGRIIAVDYTGLVTAYDDATGALRPESGSLVEGVNLSDPFNLAWRSAGSGGFIVGTQDGHLDYATPAFDTITPVGMDLSRYTSLAGFAYRPDGDLLLVMDGRPPLDAATNTRIPTVDAWSLASNTLITSVELQSGLAPPITPRHLAYVPSTQQVVATFTGGMPDPTVDAAAFVFNSDGSLAYSFNLAPLGFNTISSLAYNANTDQLLFVVADMTGTTRLVTTDRSGKPQRSYTVEGVPYLNGLAPITSGATQGDVGVVEAQPSYFARVTLQ